MVGFPEIDRIATRKRWVVTKCDLSRRVLDQSLGQLKSSGMWLQTGINVARSSGRLLWVIVPLVKFLRNRKQAALPSGRKGVTFLNSLRQKFFHRFGSK